MSVKTDTTAGKTAPITYHNKTKHNKTKHKKTSAPKPTTTKPNTKTKSKQKPKITFSFETGKLSNIEEKDTIRWAITYPACNIEIELLKMEDWLLSNPTKAKSNYRRFITNWLSSQQDKGGTKEWDIDQQRSRSVGLVKPRKKSPREVEYENLRTMKVTELIKKYKVGKKKS